MWELFYIWLTGSMFAVWRCSPRPSQHSHLTSWNIPRSRSNSNNTWNGHGQLLIPFEVKRVYTYPPDTVNHYIFTLSFNTGLAIYLHTSHVFKVLNQLQDLQPQKHPYLQHKPQCAFKWFNMQNITCWWMLQLSLKGISRVNMLFSLIITCN